MPATPVDAWALRTLGPPSLIGPEGPVKLQRRRALALLCYVCIHPFGASRERLCAMLWPDASEPVARASLRTTLSALRKAFGRPWLKASAEQVVPDPDLALTLDLDRLRGGDAAPGGPAHRWPDAAWDALSGEFLEGLRLPGCDAFEEWLYFQRERCRHLLCERLQEAAAGALADGMPAQAQRLAERWLALDPLAEPACAAMLQALMALGRVDQAQARWVEFATRLEDELGIQPSPRTRALLDAEPGAGAAATPAPHAAAPARARDGAAALLGELRYARSGAVHLAWRQLSDGQDRPWLVFISGFVSHLDQLAEEPALLRFFGQLAQRYRVLAFDKRGMGLSDRTGHPATLAETSADVLAVMAAAGVQRASLMGVSEGGPAALRCALDHPERVESLLLYGTAARWTATSDYPHVISADQYDLWLQRLAQHWGGALHLQQFAPSRADDAALIGWWARTLRMAASPGSIQAVLSNAKLFDLRAELPRVRQPVLVLHREGDQLMRVANGRFLAQTLPFARLAVLPGSDHLFWLGETERLFEAIDAFRRSLDPRP